MKHLGYLPLAIDQAGAYISTCQISFKSYIDVYEKNFRRILETRPHSLAWSYRDKTVFTTWEISFNSIMVENKASAHLLLLCSFLHNEDIKDKILRRGLELEENGKLGIGMNGF